MMISTRQQHSLRIVESKIASALRTLRKVIDAAPVIPSQQQHTYSDKYVLAEEVVTLAVASWLGVVECLGLNRAAILRLSAIARKSERVTLRITSSASCTYLRKETREVEGATKVQQTSEAFGTTTTQLIRTETDHVWSLGHSYEILAFAGASPEAHYKVTLCQRAASGEAVTKSERPPQPERVEPPPADVDLTWLLAQLEPPADGAAEAAAPRLRVSIDRSDAACVTPARNALVHAALLAAKEFHGWTAQLQRVLDAAAAAHHLRTQTRPDPRGSARPCHLFVPVLPLLQPPPPAAEANAEAHADADGPAAAAAAATAASTPPATSLVVDVRPAIGADSAVPSLSLSAATLSAILDEERRALAEEKRRVDAANPAADVPDVFLSAAEAWLATIGVHARATLEQFDESIWYVEELLRSQLTAAIGRELTPDDFASYMRHHAHKLLLPAYAPRPFCFAVRQPDRSPEGVIAMEAMLDGATTPIETIVRTMAEPSPPMSFALDAATRVTFHGERHLHCYIAHAFGRERGGRGGAPSAPSALTLAMRARQFSCFLVLVGRLGAGGTLEPQHGLIVRNKDELKIPLLLEQLARARDGSAHVSASAREAQLRRSLPCCASLRPRSSVTRSPPSLPSSSALRRPTARCSSRGPSLACSSFSSSRSSRPCSACRATASPRRSPSRRCASCGGGGGGRRRAPRLWASW
jgi:hypothetical protein